MGMVSRSAARRAIRFASLASVRFALLSSALAFPACHDDPPPACENATCVCSSGSECSFTCKAPPCHALCESGSACEGACGNGECTCESEATCAFQCESPPCHVKCSGDNPQCSGTCANGSCDCGPNSTCDFTCQSGPCHTSCGAGSSCVVHCPNASPGTQDCDITRCEGGEVVLCPDGKTTTCNAACPVTQPVR